MVRRVFLLRLLFLSGFLLVLLGSVPALADWHSNAYGGISAGSPSAVCDAIFAKASSLFPPASGESTVAEYPQPTEYYLCDYNDSTGPHNMGISWVSGSSGCTPADVKPDGTCPPIACVAPQVPDSLGTSCVDPSPSACVTNGQVFTGSACAASCPSPLVATSDGNCVQPTPATCGASGALFDEASGQCQSTCPAMSIQMGNECVSEAPPKDKNGADCNVFSPDYVGGVTTASGGLTNVCSNQVSACKASGGSYGLVNGNPVCVPKGYTTPVCASGSVNVIPESGGSYGFACTDAAGNNKNFDASGNPTSSPGASAPALSPTAASNLNGAANPAQGNNANYNYAATNQLGNIENQMAALNSKSLDATSAANANGGKLDRIDTDLRRNTLEVSGVTSAVSSLNDSLTGGTSGALSSGRAYLTSAPSSLWVSGPFSSVTSAVKNTKFDGAQTKSQFTGLFDSVFPQSATCHTLSISSGSAPWSMTIDCATIGRLRAILSWIIYLFTIYTIFDYLMESNKGK